MKKSFFILCGENGVLIKYGIPFLWAQEMLYKYCKGDCVIKRADNLEEAQMCAFNHALEQKQPHKIPRNIGLNQMVLFRFYPEVVEPMEFE